MPTRRPQPTLAVCAMAAAALFGLAGCSDSSGGESGGDDPYCSAAEKLSQSNFLDFSDREAALDAAKTFEQAREAAPDEIRGDFDTIEEVFRTGRGREDVAPAAQRIKDYTQETCDVDLDIG